MLPCGGAGPLTLLLLSAAACIRRHLLRRGLLRQSHKPISRKHWAGARRSRDGAARHDRSSVRGDFTRATITLRNDNYTLSSRNGAYYITESLPHRPSPRTSNRLHPRQPAHPALPHHSARRPHSRPAAQLGHPPQTVVPQLRYRRPRRRSGQLEVQLWNKNCYSCHVQPGKKKNFNPRKDRIQNRLARFRGQLPSAATAPASSTRREPCRHSEAKRSSTRHRSPDPPRPRPRHHGLRPVPFLPRHLRPPGFNASGDDYYDHFVPILEFDQPVDKRSRLTGPTAARAASPPTPLVSGKASASSKPVSPASNATSTRTTPASKSPQLRPRRTRRSAPSATPAIGKAVSAHTHHAEKSAGSSCVECHMPRTVLSIKAQIRDHSITSAVPENTINRPDPQRLQ